MLNLDAVRTLTRHGYEMPAILAAIHAAETNGSADLDGWTIRYNDRGEMITVHPSWCGIYVGDYSAHIIFQKNISYTFSRYGFMNAKYRDLSAVLEKLDAAKTTGFILCECCACDFPRRRPLRGGRGLKSRRTQWRPVRPAVAPYEGGVD